MPAKTNTRVNGIDGIRFMLALIVLLSHLHDPYAGLLKAQHTFAGYAAGVIINHLFCGPRL